MGKIDNFSIILYKQNAVYFSGESVKGVINIRVSDRLKCNSISIVLNGKARVHWSETSGSGKNRSTRNYTATESYLDTKVMFLSKQSSNDLYLDIGEYSYPFEIILPKNLPTSFEHNFGQVRYNINGTIDIPWAFDKHTTKSFSVINNVDLNCFGTSIKQPIGLSGAKIFCCWCCASEPVTAKFEILKGGYVPGEAIVFSAFIDNKSDRYINELSVKLIQQLKFHANSKTRSCTRNVANIINPNKIPGREIYNWDRGQLLIPSVCPSSNGTCKIIEIHYCVQFSFGASSSLDSHLSIPIKIGTIPLRNEQIEETNLLTPSLPTYEECMFGSNPNKELAVHFDKGDVLENDSNIFKPSYPYYKDYSVS